MRESSVKIILDLSATKVSTYIPTCIPNGQPLIVILPQNSWAYVVYHYSDANNSAILSSHHNNVSQGNHDNQTGITSSGVPLIDDPVYTTSQIVTVKYIRCSIPEL